MPNPTSPVCATWQPIETAPQNGKPITVRRGKKIHRGAFWFEGDLTAGWANRFGRPLGFEPTSWTGLNDAPPEAT